MEQRRGQEGGRWVNQRPSGEEVGAWFRENVHLHDDRLDHDHYVQGLTLIQQEAREKEVVGFSDDNKPIIAQVENLYYVPYAKVETRVKYFWDYVGLHDDWLGVIEAVPPASPIASLPSGFGKLAVTLADGKVAHFVTCSMRARILLRDTVEEKIVSAGGRDGERRVVLSGQAIMEGAPATKQVPVLSRYGADSNALMKAETGAVGRALGLLGMLVVPGSGVATAEDVQEAISEPQQQAQAAPAEGEKPQAEEDDDQLRKEVIRLLAELESADKQRLEEFRRWARDDRKITLNEATSPQLRGLIRKLGEEIAAAKADAEGKDVEAEEAAK